MHRKYSSLLMVLTVCMCVGCTGLFKAKGQPQPDNSSRISMVGVFTPTNVSSDNQVIEFFWDVELRYMADAQLKEVLIALEDMEKLSATELKAKRYADFYGTTNEWTLLQLLYAYFVPAQEVVLGESFYQDLEQEEAREIVRRTRYDIQSFQRTGEQPAIPDQSEKW